MEVAKDIHESSVGEEITNDQNQTHSERSQALNKSINTHFGQSKISSPQEDDAERLSSDLALFLSNPTLRQGLADGSLDLASYSSTIESELATLEHECIRIYRSNIATTAALRKDMDDCDVILASLQEMLMGFQADLGGLSGDIRSLQEQSYTLGIQLQNRRNAELGLRRFIKRILVPPSLADAICTGPIDEKFMDCVQELERMHQYVNTSASQEDTKASHGIPPSDTVAGKEMKEHIHKLRLRAVSRIRTYFLHKISELRQPKTNVRMIQVNSFVKYSILADFLLKAAPDFYSEVRQVYAESMGRTLHALFRTYASQLSLLDNQIATRKDVIAAEEFSLKRDTSVATVFSPTSSHKSNSKRGDAFCLGGRSAVLEMYDPDEKKTSTGQLNSKVAATLLEVSNSDNFSSPILAHVAIAEGKQYPYEMIFKSTMMHLMDAATNEYIFVRKFFKENGSDVVNVTFNRTLSLLLEQLENYLFNCYDCLGLLLMIKLTHAQKRIMKERNVDTLDKFFDSITKLLWPRLKTVMDKQIRSVRDGQVKKLGGIDLHSHYVSRRYAEFTCSILQILSRGRDKVIGSKTTSTLGTFNHSTTATSYSTRGKTLKQSEKRKTSGQSNVKGIIDEQASLATSHRGSAGDMLLHDLSRLLDEIVLLLERMADSHATNKKRIIFMINNLDQIISIFNERRVQGRELNRFVDLLTQQREQFVEEELLQCFSKMIAFVQNTEHHILQQHGSNATTNQGKQEKRIDVNAQVVESLVTEFASTWKQGIEQINRNVLSFFANFRNGMEILKQVLTQLLLYYTRFQDIIRKVWRSKPPAFCKDLVSTSTILVEIKKHALAI